LIVSSTLSTTGTRLIELEIGEREAGGRLSGQYARLDIAGDIPFHLFGHIQKSEVAMSLKATSPDCGSSAGNP
jgi:hypothetical protein